MKFLNLFRLAYAEETLMRFDCTPELEARLARVVGVISPDNLKKIRQKREYCEKIAALAEVICKEYGLDAELEAKSPAAQAMYEIYLGENNRAIALLPKLPEEEVDAIIYDAHHNRGDGIGDGYPLLEFGKCASETMKQGLLSSALGGIDADYLELLAEMLGRHLSNVEVDLVVLGANDVDLAYSSDVERAKHGASATIARLLARNMLDATDDEFARVMDELEESEQE